MPSLGFALLDQHVVSGRADDVAVHTSDTTLTFARLLERSAAVAGGLKALGLQPGDDLSLGLPHGTELVTVVCACLRLGVLSGTQGRIGVREVDGVPTVTIEGEDPVELDLLRRAGASDPAVALPHDAEGFRAAAQERHPQIVEPLLLGRTVAFA